MKTIPVNRFPEIPERDLRREPAAAAWLTARIDESEHFERLTQRSVSAVWFRFVPPRLSAVEVDALNASLVRRVNEVGDVGLTEARLEDGRVALRFALSGSRVQAEQMRRDWDAIASHAAELRGERA